LLILSDRDGDMVVASGREPQPTAESDVTITIGGQTAALIYKRGGVEAQETEEALRALKEKVAEMEATAASDAQQKADLSESVRELRDRVVHLEREATDLRTELRAQRGEIADHVNYTFRSLQERVENLAAAATRPASDSDTVAPSAATEARPGSGNGAWSSRFGLWAAAVAAITVAAAAAAALTLPG
jgi:hypothetical protein